MGLAEERERERIRAAEAGIEPAPLPKETNYDEIRSRQGELSRQIITGPVREDRDMTVGEDEESPGKAKEGASRDLPVSSHDAPGYSGNSNQNTESEEDKKPDSPTRRFINKPKEE